MARLLTHRVLVALLRFQYGAEMDAMVKLGMMSAVGMSFRSVLNNLLGLLTSMLVLGYGGYLVLLNTTGIVDTGLDAGSLMLATPIPFHHSSALQALMMPSSHHQAYRLSFRAFDSVWFCSCLSAGKLIAFQLYMNKMQRSFKSLQQQAGPLSIIPSPHEIAACPEHPEGNAIAVPCMIMTQCGRLPHVSPRSRASQRQQGQPNGSWA